MECDNGSVASALKNVSSSMLLSLLRKIDGQKDIILCEQLISVIDMICGYKVLKEIGVEKIFKINNSPVANTKRLCFIIKSAIGDIRKVCNWLNMFQSKEMNDLQYWIIFVPQKTYECEQYLEQEGLYSYFTIWELSLGFIPLDHDLFSLELNDLYQDYLVFGDYLFLNSVVQSMHKVQRLLGLFDTTVIKGRASEFVCDNLQKLNALSGLIEQTHPTGYSIDLFVVDREEDYGSLFLSQLNYTGILDETFSINCGKIELDSDLIKETQLSKHNLCKGDTIFPEVKDLFFSSVCSSLKEKGQKLRQKSYERQSMNLTEMKEFLAKEMRNIQSEHKMLFLHINICEKIMEKKKLCKFSSQLRMEQSMIEGNEPRAVLSFIEDGIMKQYPKAHMLRLICLYSLCHSGITSKDLHNLIRLFTQSYGHRYITAFYYLKKIGIIYESSNQFNFVPSTTTQKLASISSVGGSTSEAIKKFRHNIKKYSLIPLLEAECYSTRNPSDAGYVFGGVYYPFVCKLVHALLEPKSSAQLDEWCKQANCKQQPSLIPCQQANRQVQTNTKRIQVVLFVGGVTYAEVSALRLLAKHKGIHILILTTSITNGNTFLEALFAKSF